MDNKFIRDEIHDMITNGRAVSYDLEKLRIDNKIPLRHFVFAIKVLLEGYEKVDPGTCEYVDGFKRIYELHKTKK